MMPTATAAGSQPSSAYISIDSLRISYDGRTPVVQDLDMVVEQGDFVSVLGPSGCGKSTLLHALSGLLEPASGTVEVGGHRVHKGARDAPAVGYVFQDHRLLPWRTVAQNIRLVLKASGVPDNEQKARVSDYLSMLQIERFHNSWPMRLSGGQRQRVSIARALALHPAVVLMDEPFSTLDEVTARVMRQQLADLWERHHQTIVFVTHSIREAIFLSNRIVILTRGPARVLDVVDVLVARPRRYEDPRLTELEASIVERVMGEWGYDNREAEGARS
jgi:NitT/TauT family transport system ATP-binding protein